MRKRPGERRPLPEIRTTAQGTFQAIKKGELGRRVELYSMAYKLVWQQISPTQRRERPDISLRIHASIRKQLKAGATDPRSIAAAALKDVIPDDC